MDDIDSKMNTSFEDTLSCAFCESRLSKPVFLPCGHSICQKHQKEAPIGDDITIMTNGTVKNKTILCKRCKVSYIIPESGFTRNIMGEQMLENRLDLVVEQNAAFKSCLQLKKLANKIRRLQTNPHLIVKRVLGDLKSKVSKKRDDLRKKIDDDADKLVGDLDVFEKECLKTTIRSSTTEQLLKTYDDCLSKWENEQLSAERDVEGWKAVTTNSKIYYANLRNEFIQTEKAIFCGKLADIKKRQEEFCRLNINSEIPKKIKITCDVRNVQTCAGKPAYKACESEYGVDWLLIVTIENNANSNEKMIVAYLCPNKNNDKYNLQIDAELAILNKVDQTKSIVKNFVHSTEENRGKKCYIVELSKIISNPEFCDANDDLFTVQATISQIKWIKIE